MLGSSSRCRCGGGGGSGVGGSGAKCSSGAAHSTEQLAPPAKHTNGSGAVTLHTSFSSIKVNVPRGAGFNVDARTTFGSINTDVPIMVTRKSDETLTGTINGGGCKMELVNANGSITVGQE